MDEQKEFDSLFSFFAETEKFREVERQIDRNDGSRENDAEHTWHCSLIAITLHNKLTVPVDLGHALEIIAVHDLPEIYAGDVSAFDKAKRKGKNARERKAAQKLFSLLPDKNKLKSLWEEYERGETSEAKFAKAIDVIQARVHHIINQGKTVKRLKVTEEMIRNHKVDIMSFDPFINKFSDYLVTRASQEDVFYKEE